MVSRFEIPHDADHFSLQNLKPSFYEQWGFDATLEQGGAYTWPWWGSHKKTYGGTCLGHMMQFF